jgi:hypothetical protein
MADALARHDRLCREGVADHGGHVVTMTGDGMHAAFGHAEAALAASVALQRGVARIAGDTGLPLRMRCGLHAGRAQERDGDYFGGDVNRAARLMAAAHGGQILVSQAVVEQARERLGEGATLRHLGRVRLRDLSAACDVWQVVHGARGARHGARPAARVPRDVPRPGRPIGRRGVRRAARGRRAGEGRRGAGRAVVERDGLDRERRLAAAREALGDAFDDAWREGAATSMDDAVSAVLAS